MPGDLYYGDNLEVLRRHVADGSVDLIYLDPPFNSDRTYNLIHKDSSSQARAFVDTWRWDEAAERSYAELVGDLRGARAFPPRLVGIMRALKDFLWERQRDTLAYVTMMAGRLVEMHRVLHPTGSLYLHCDPTASHHLRLMLDAIFGEHGFRNEVVWKRYGSHGDSATYGAVHDVLLFYAKSRTITFNKQFIPYSREYAESRFRHLDPTGRRYQEQNLASPSPRPNLTYDYRASNGVIYRPHRNGWKCDLDRMRQLDREGRLHFPSKPGGRLRMKMYLDECHGVPVQDVWTDIDLPSSSRERLGYPTQKPVALLERIVRASSNDGDLVLDPFCGCGTTIEAAETLRRRWLGIDVAIRAIEVIKDRLDVQFPTRVWTEHGEPSGVEEAAHLAATNPYDFQWWVVRQLGGKPPGGVKKKGADGGVDGELELADFVSGTRRRALISVKGGETLTPDFVKALRTTVDLSKADYGILVTMRAPTEGMRRVARECGLVPWSGAEGQGKMLRRIVLLTVPEILAGTAQLPGRNVTPRSPSMPPPPEARVGETLGLPFPAAARAKPKRPLASARPRTSDPPPKAKRAR